MTTEVPDTSLQAIPHKPGFFLREQRGKYRSFRQGSSRPSGVFPGAGRIHSRHQREGPTYVCAILV